ncbi:hypothetical protein FWG76_02455, partial [Candidatus Saccharibacteria bacterium]|nr:hypothetical protein [Candidatus Saccharibacteria bacterium]
PIAPAAPVEPVSSPFGGESVTPFSPDPTPAPATATPVAAPAGAPAAANDPFATGASAPKAKGEGLTIGGKKLTPTTLILIIVLGVLVLGGIGLTIFLTTNNPG